VTYERFADFTGATIVASWPCAQCRALGRNAPLTYISDGGTVPDGGGVTPTGIPHDRLDAYLATFPRRPPRHRCRADTVLAAPPVAMPRAKPDAEIADAPTGSKVEHVRGALEERVDAAPRVRSQPSMIIV
jgi:hypothetical protein